MIALACIVGLWLAGIEAERKGIARVKVQDFSGTSYVERDLALIRVHSPVSRRGEILELADIFRARGVDVGRSDVMLELSGTEDKIEAMLDLLRPYGIREMVRAGRIALQRSSRD